MKVSHGSGEEENRLRKPAEHRIHLCFLTADTMGTAGLYLPVMIDCIPS